MARPQSLSTYLSFVMLLLQFIRLFLQVIDPSLLWLLCLRVQIFPSRELFHNFARSEAPGFTPTQKGNISQSFRRLQTADVWAKSCEGNFFKKMAAMCYSHKQIVLTNCSQILTVPQYSDVKRLDPQNIYTKICFVIEATCNTVFIA